MAIDESELCGVDTINDMVYLNLVSVFNKDYVDIVNFFSNQPSKILVSLLLVFAYFFFSFKY